MAMVTKPVIVFKLEILKQFKDTKEKMVHFIFSCLYWPNLESLEVTWVIVVEIETV